MAVPKKKKSHHKVFFKKRHIFMTNVKFINKTFSKNKNKFNLKEIFF